MELTPVQTHADRLRAEIERRSHLVIPPPRTNPWQYSNSRSSYPSNPEHVDWRDPKRHYRSRLLLACVAGDITGARDLLNDGASPFVRDVKRDNAFNLAVDWGHRDLAIMMAKIMDRIVSECHEYERQTGMKLGLKSVRRFRKRPSGGIDGPSLTYFEWLCQYGWDRSPVFFDLKK